MLSGHLLVLIMNITPEFIRGKELQPIVIRPGGTLEDVIDFQAIKGRILIHPSGMTTLLVGLVPRINSCPATPSRRAGATIASSLRDAFYRDCLRFNRCKKMNAVNLLFQVN